MYKYTVSRGRDSDISKIVSNAFFYVCFKAGLLIAALFCLFRYIVKVETQDFASHKGVCAIWRCECIPMKVCANKVETQNFASPELALRNMAVRMCAGENMLYLLVRRKILCLYWLARQM